MNSTSSTVNAKYRKNKKENSSKADEYKPVSYLEQFESDERIRLGLEEKPVDHWYDSVPMRFTREQREHTTLLFAGLTIAQDRFIEAALKGLGYKVKALDCPDNKALNFGKEFGNRGQCNPTYFTVGNLLKYLHYLRDEKGLSKDDIVKNYLFVTAGSCGPCRFGTYVTEYRKALRDADFEGFRVLLFQQQGGLNQVAGDNCGLLLNKSFFIKVITADIVGDILNVLGYRIRPFELEKGMTDFVLKRCQDDICKALAENRSVIMALYRCRKELEKIRIDRTQPKPRVAIIGEFWAMTTEGDGNYKLQKFLESEGAEVDIQTVTAWILYTIWGGIYDIRRRENLKGMDSDSLGLQGINSRNLSIKLWCADKAIRIVFQFFARIIGLKDFHLPDMDELAKISHRFYDNHLRGGEGHMEVGKVMMNVIHNKVNMTVSVKPFGCMPSSGVSDGVQSLITELYPKTIFLPIETTGDGAVNVYSRIQMQLFKARQVVKQEIAQVCKEYNLDNEIIEQYLSRHPQMQGALHRSPHQAGSSSADLIHEIGTKIRRWKILGDWLLNFGHKMLLQN